MTYFITQFSSFSIFMLAALVHFNMFAKQIFRKLDDDEIYLFIKAENWGKINKLIRQKSIITKLLLINFLLKNKIIK